MKDAKEELLRWLQEKRDILRFTLKNPEEKDEALRNVMKGQLDAYSSVLAFISSEGRLR